MNKKSLNLILLSFIFVSSLMFISAADSSSVLSEAVPWSKTFLSQIFNLGETWSEFIIGLIMLLIITTAIYNILDITSIFGSTAVKVIISVGFGIIFAITGMVNWISIGMTQFAVGFGAFAIWIEIIMSVLIFLGLSLGIFPWLAKWAAKRKSDAVEVAAIKGAGKIRAGVRTAKALGEEAGRGE